MDFWKFTTRTLWGRRRGPVERLKSLTTFRRVEGEVRPEVGERRMVRRRLKAFFLSESETAEIGVERMDEREARRERTSEGERSTESDGTM